MKLGSNVKIIARYKRNGRKPDGQSKDNTRYDLIDLKENHIEGIIMGKRTIHIKGFLDYDDDTSIFVTMQTESVYIIAISMKETMYVPLDKVELIGDEL